MKLNTWIVNTGQKKVAGLLNVDPSTVGQWKVSNTLPRPEHMVKINKLTKGRVTFEEMVVSVAKKQSKQKK